MTPLPQRKKTAEEIAQLRDQLGVPQSVESSEESAPLEAEPSQSSGHTEETAPASKTGTLSAPTYPGHTPQDSKPQPQATSGLPVRKRSAEELEEMRRRDMLSQMGSPPVTNIKFMAAHPALIAMGYLLAAIGACSFWIKAYPWLAIIAGSVLALAIATFLFLRRPVSRHHAGFISAISVLVGVFATIHHFPQLQHAS